MNIVDNRVSSTIPYRYIEPGEVFECCHDIYLKADTYAVRISDGHLEKGFDLEAPVVRLDDVSLVIE